MRRTSRKRLPPPRRLHLEMLEHRHLLATLYGIEGGDTLIRFDSAAPALVASLAITGLAPFESIVGIDTHAGDGQLFGIGSFDNLYTIDKLTAAASLVGAGGFVPSLGGFEFGVDFNPVSGRIRVVDDLDNNLRLNAQAGVVEMVDSPLAYDPFDINALANPNVTAAAYTNNQFGVASTTLFGIDSSLDVLVRQGSPGGFPLSPNTGRLFTVGALGVDTSAIAGFDVSGETGVAYAALEVFPGGFSQLATIDLATGAATLIGPIGAGLLVDSLAVDDLRVFVVSTTVNPEGNLGFTDAVFPVVLSGPSPLQVTVNYLTFDGTAVSPNDYILMGGVVTFAPGEVVKFITIPVVGDLLDEVNEDFFLGLFAPTNAVPGFNVAFAQIIDDDLPPLATIDNVTVLEGDALPVNAVFSVNLSSPSGQTVQLNFATSDNTAIAPGDYAATAGMLTFSPGVTSQLLTVSVAGDLLDELSETFSVTLSAPINATVGGPGIGLIVDNDLTPTAAIGDVSVVEGNLGALNAVFNINLSAPSGLGILFDFATADGFATAPSDYLAISSSLFFMPGQTSGSFTVPVASDTICEPNESFFVNLTAFPPAAVLLPDPQAIGLILDNDPAAVTITDTTIVEGDAGSVDAVLTVSLSNPCQDLATVRFDSNFTRLDDDCNVIPFTFSGTLAFFPGQTARNITVPVLGNMLDENNATLAVTLSNGVNAAIFDNQGLILVLDNDPAPDISIINGLTSPEGNAGLTPFQFPVTLSRKSARTITVTYAVTGDTATAGADFVAATGTLTFAPCEVAQTLVVPVVGEIVIEPDENFWVTLTGQSNANAIVNSQAEAFILNDDNLVVVGADAGNEPIVRVYNAADLGAGPIRSFLAFARGFGGGVRVAAADINRDGAADIVAAAGPGGGPHVRVFDGLTGAQLLGSIGSFYAYLPEFRGGLFVAAGDTNGDNQIDIITGPDATGGPHIKSFDGSGGGELLSFYAYDPAINCGVRVASGDINDDGRDDIVAGMGPGVPRDAQGNPVSVMDFQVVAFDSAALAAGAAPFIGAGIGGMPVGLAPARLDQFDAFPARRDPLNPMLRTAYTGGVHVAVANLNNDDWADIVVSAGNGDHNFAGGTAFNFSDAGPIARTYLFNGLEFDFDGAFFAYNPDFMGSVRVGAVGDVNGDLRPDIVTGAGPGGGPHVRIVSGGHAFTASTPPASGNVSPGPAPALVDEVFAFDAEFLLGIWVAGSDIQASR